MRSLFYLKNFIEAFFSCFCTENRQPIFNPIIVIFMTTDDRGKSCIQNNSSHFTSHLIISRDLAFITTNKYLILFFLAYFCSYLYFIWINTFVSIFLFFYIILKFCNCVRTTFFDISYKRRKIPYCSGNVRQ